MITFISKKDFFEREYPQTKEYAQELTRTSGIDMVKYVEILTYVSKDTIKNIYHDLLEGIDVDKYLWSAARLDRRKELLAEKYKQDGYNEEQIKTILYYTTWENIYLTPYITPDFNVEQIKQVADGMMAEVDIK